MRTANESSMLVARAIQKLKDMYCQHCTQDPGVEDIIFLLETALEKLVIDMT